MKEQISYPVYKKGFHPEVDPSLVYTDDYASFASMVSPDGGEMPGEIVLALPPRDEEERSVRFTLGNALDDGRVTPTLERLVKEKKVFQPHLGARQLTLYVSDRMDAIGFGEARSVSRSIQEAYIAEPIQLPVFVASAEVTPIEDEKKPWRKRIGSFATVGMAAAIAGISSVVRSISVK